MSKLNKYYGQTGGNAAILENKEYVKTGSGKVLKIKNAPKHEDKLLKVGRKNKKVPFGRGGVVVPNVVSALSATHENRTSKSKLYTYKDEEIKIMPKEVKAISMALALPVKLQKKAISPAKLLDLLVEKRDNTVKKYRDPIDSSRRSPERFSAITSNRAVLASLPTTENLYDFVFDLQESKKSGGFGQTLAQTGMDSSQQEMSVEEQLMQLFQAFADVMQDDEFNTAEEVMEMFQQLSPEEQERFIQQAIQIVQGAQQYEDDDEEEEEYDEEYDDEEEPMMQKGGWADSFKNLFNFEGTLQSDKNPKPSKKVIKDNPYRQDLIKYAKTIGIDNFRKEFEELKDISTNYKKEGFDRKNRKYGYDHNILYKNKPNSSYEALHKVMTFDKLNGSPAKRVIGDRERSYHETPIAFSTINTNEDQKVPSISNILNLAKTDLFKNYVAEMSHNKQVDVLNKKHSDYKAGSNYENSYYEDGTMENNAHYVIEPQIVKEYFDVPDSKYFKNIDSISRAPLHAKYSQDIIKARNATLPVIQKKTNQKKSSSFSEMEKNFLDRFELKQKGGNVLYVESKNDPRYKSYADSLYNYNTGVKLKNAVRNIKDLITVRKGSAYDVALQKTIKSRNLNDNSSDPESDPNIRSILSEFQKKGNKSILPNRYNSYMADTRNDLKDLVLGRPFTDMLGLTEKRNTKSYILPEWKKPNQQVTVNPIKNQTNAVQYKKPQQPVRVVERQSLPPIERLDFKPFQEYQTRFHPLEIESETEYIPGAYQGYERVIDSEYGKNADGQYNEFIHKYAPGKTIFKSNIKQTGGIPERYINKGFKNAPATWQTGPQRIDAKDALGNTYTKLDDTYYVNNRNKQKYTYNPKNKTFNIYYDNNRFRKEDILEHQRNNPNFDPELLEYMRLTEGKKAGVLTDNNNTRPLYHPIFESIIANPIREDFSEHVLSEFAHSKRLKNKTLPELIFRGVKDWLKQPYLPESIVKNLGYDYFSRQHQYYTPGTEEYVAHEEIEPLLSSKYSFLKDLKNTSFKDPTDKKIVKESLKSVSNKLSNYKQTGGKEVKTKLTNYPYMKGSRPALSTSNGKSIEALDGRTISMDQIYDADSVIVKGNEGKTFYKSKLKKYIK